MGNFCPECAGAGPGETKGGGKFPAQMLGDLFSKMAVLELKCADASPQSQTASFLTGSVNPRSAVYPVQTVFGCEGDEPI